MAVHSTGVVITLSHVLYVDILSVAPTPRGTGARAPHFYKWLGTGAP